MKVVLSILILTATLFSFDESSGHFIEALPKKDLGADIYNKNCASCHHKDRIGTDGPALFSKTLTKYKDVSSLLTTLKQKCKKNTKGKLNLNEVKLVQVAKYIKKDLDSSTINKYSKDHTNKALDILLQKDVKKADFGKKLYLTYCASCHHKDRIGLEGPPLFDKNLRKYRTISKLYKKIKNGFPQTLMPKFENLSDIELIFIARHIKKPLNKNIKWGKEDIVKSTKIYNNAKKDIGIKDMADVMPVVERDGNKVWIMEKEKILDKFELKNVHGGIKYKFPTLDSVFVPTRDGNIVKYSLKNGRVEAKSRACINLRNLSLSRDGKYTFVTCLLPQQLVVYNSEDLSVKEIKKLDGKVSALYELYTKDKAIFTYRDKPKVAYLDTKSLKLTYKDIDEPIEDFFIDPFDKYLIATARGGKLLRVYEIDTLKKVFEHKMKGMPHLFSATYFYKDGNFYFATPHLRSSFITIWQMYNWKFVKKIDIGGDGFFAKTHPNTPYLWVDNGSDELILVNKKDYSIKKLVPVKGKQYIHAEFSGDAKYTYLSIYEHNGSIEVWDTKTLKKLKSYPANIPVGKYNFICKNRRFYPMLFGLEIVNEKFKNLSDDQIFNKLKSNDGKFSELEVKAIMAYLKYKKNKSK
jgi:mono/diheme cytochrome c family protein/6-phosphogluconolactonase (cycloisomerase 2 family)